MRRRRSACSDLRCNSQRKRSKSSFRELFEPCLEIGGNGSINGFKQLYQFMELYIRLWEPSGAHPEDIVDPIQVISQADALGHPMMQVESIVEVGRYDCPSFDPEDFMRFQTAIGYQQRLVRIAQCCRELI